MRQIDRIVIHCSATRCSQDFSPEQVKSSHLARGFRTWGYHYYIRKLVKYVLCGPLIRWERTPRDITVTLSGYVMKEDLMLLATRPIQGPTLKSNP